MKQKLGNGQWLDHGSADWGPIGTSRLGGGAIVAAGVSWSRIRALDDKVCSRGHVGRYTLDSRGRAECRACASEDKAAVRRRRGTAA